MTPTFSRTVQYVIILFILGLASSGGWWYYQKSQAATRFQASQNTNLTSGLIGLWSFDGGDISGTSALDRSVTGNNGTLTGGVTPIIGRLGQALSFNGTSGFINLGAYTTEQTDYTVSVWFYYTDTSETGSMFFRGDTNLCAYNPNIRVTSGSVEVRESGCSGAGVIGSQALSVGWHHIVVTRSGQTDILYYDGTSIVTDNSQPAGNFSESVFAIGATAAFSGGTRGEYFNDKIDDVRIYDRAFTPAEVSELYKTTGAKVTAQASRNNVLTNGLIGLWSFDGPDVSGTTVYDRSGSGNNGTMDASLRPAVGRIGQGIRFDGTAWDMLNITSSTNLEMGTGDMTITGWLNIEATTAGYQGIFWKGGEGTEGYLFAYDDTSHSLVVNVDTGAGNTYFSQGGVSLVGTGWRMLTAVIDRDAGVTFYIDGASPQTFGSSVYNGTDITNTGRNGRIGTLSFYGLTGALDDVRVYNRTLSANEVAGLYLLGR